MEVAGQDDALMPELSEELMNRLVNLETQSRLNSLTMVELRGIMKQLNRPTKGTKHVLLVELSKFLRSKHCLQHFSSALCIQDVRLSVQASSHSDERGCKRTHAEIDIHTTSSKCVKLETKRMAVDDDAASASVLAHKKPKPEWVAYDPAAMRPPLTTAGHHKIISWNVNGLRALLKRKDGEKQALARLAQAESFDVLCLQETKLQEKDVEGIKSSILEDYPFSFWSCSTSKLGYSGSAVISRTKPLAVTFGLGVPSHDEEGRIITAEFDGFYLVNAYVPNSGQKLERLDYRTNEWDPAFSKFLMDLQKRKPVILTGDLNCAHQEIDIHDPDRNRRSAGFTDEERASFESQFLRKGLVDTFRRQHPNAVAYTYWNYRTGARRHNKGWRLDYFLVSETLVNSAVDSYTIPEVDGSDHCPVGLILVAM